MRYAFTKELLNQAKKNKNITLLTGDLGFTVFEEFQAKYPRQFINAGVSEANMMSVAAGLTLAGKRAFTYSIATFSSMRPFEQIRNDICYQDLPVVIIGSGAGLSYPDAGPSHYAIEDIAALRALPNLSIVCPSDPIEMTYAVRYATKTKHPLYLRIGKKGEINLHNDSYVFKFGKADVLKIGKDILLIASGNIVANTMKAAELLTKLGINAGVVNMHTVKPIDRSFLKKASEKYANLVTVEEHSIHGGLGSAVSEVVCGFANRPLVTQIGIDQRIKKVGDHDFLRNLYGLTPSKIANKVKSILR